MFRERLELNLLNNFESCLKQVTFKIDDKDYRKEEWVDGTDDQILFADTG